MKKLLIETFPIRLESNQLLESFKKNDGRLIIPNMIIQRADVPNKNRRIYTRSVLDREAKKVVESAKQSGSRGVLGELDHPDSSVINLKNACLGVLDYRWKGNDMLGDVEILYNLTPSGTILGNLMKAGYVPGISSRGLGSVENALDDHDPDIVVVQEDFELLCWDGVSDPSTHNAYFKEIKENTLHENVRVQSDKYQKIHDLTREIICELSGVCCLK